jgi:predicted Rossmann fold flavoprotein
MPITVAIVGGGAAGIMAALAARSVGARAVIYERNPRLGIKILISGGGKCNITHDAPPREIENGFITREARFLRHALHELTSAQVIEALENEGLETMTRPNGRVFPVSGRADDVLAAFERLLDRAGAEVVTRATVEGIIVRDGVAVGVRIAGTEIAADAVIVATGGLSYRKVGTTGDGIEWARALGHEITTVRAALAPLYFDHPPPSDWQGVALRDIVLSVEAPAAAKEMSRLGLNTVWRDDLLLTHRGISGPATLEISRAAAFARELGGDVRLRVDLVPDIGEPALAAEWERRLATSGRSEVQSFVESYVPSALVDAILAAAAVPRGTKIAAVTRDRRRALLSTLKRWEPGRIGEAPIDRGEVTAGGVALGEVSPKTMESRRIRNLYLAGEALDIAGCVGGYNLQAAFSTGFVAGRHAGSGAGQRE